MLQASTEAEAMHYSGLQVVSRVLLFRRVHLDICLFVSFIVTTASRVTGCNQDKKTKTRGDDK